MTTTVDTALPTAGTGSGRSVPSGGIWFARDSATEASRHLIATIRNPDLLVFATIQPIMFVVLFVYVFGGSITVPGGDYVQYVVPGIFAQTVVFGSAFTGIGIAEDMSKGFMDRLRSLPMYPAGVLLGRTTSDLVRNTFTFGIMFVVGLIVGFRIVGGIPDAVIATLLLLFFGFAFSWIQAWIGLSVKSVEAANSAGFIWMFPMTFISSAFVSPENMPTWLQPIADNNPFTIVTNATRALYNGWAPGNDVWVSIAWAVGITLGFGALSFRKFGKQSR